MLVLTCDQTKSEKMNFPCKLMELMSNPSNADAISWLPHGKAFAILNRKKFTDHVVSNMHCCKAKSKYFLMKLLQQWGFIQLKSSSTRGEIYFHKYFQRDRASLCARMHKSNQSKFSVALRQSKTKNKAISTAIKSNQTVIGPFLAFNSTSFDSKKPEATHKKSNQENPVKDVSMKNVKKRNQKKQSTKYKASSENFKQQNPTKDVSMKNANGRYQNKKISGKTFSKKENLPNNAKTLQKRKVTPVKKHRTGKMKNSSEMKKTKARNVAKRHTKSLDKAAPKRNAKSHDKNQVKNEQKKQGQNLRGEERAYQQRTSNANTGDKPPKSNEKHRKSEAKQKRGQKMLTEEQAYQKQINMF